MNQRVMLTKRLLKESLLKLLEKKRINHISVKELCIESGINRSTFYAHYGEPRDVLTDIVKDHLAEISTIISNDNGLSPKERLLKMCEFLYSNIKLEQIFYFNRSDEDIVKFCSEINFALLIPEQYIYSKVFEDKNNESYALVFINYGIYHVLRKWLMTDAQKTPKEIAELIGKIILK